MAPALALAATFAALLCLGAGPALAGQRTGTDRGPAASEPGKSAGSTAGEAAGAARADAKARRAIKPAVQVRGPRLSGGQITGIRPRLEKVVDTVARCVVDHGGLGARRGRIDLQFLVRARGRAEAVEIVACRGVELEAARCVQQALKNRWLGAPTAEPVGVDLTFLLSAEQPADRASGEASRPAAVQQRKRRQP